MRCFGAWFRSMRSRSASKSDPPRSPVSPSHHTLYSLTAHAQLHALDALRHFASASALAAPSCFARSLRPWHRASRLSTRLQRGSRSLAMAAGDDAPASPAKAAAADKASAADAKRAVASARDELKTLLAKKRAGDKALVRPRCPCNARLMTRPGDARVDATRL